MSHCLAGRLCIFRDAAVEERRRGYERRFSTREGDEYRNTGELVSAA